MQFIKISGGLEGGSEPPAFQRAERLRMEAAKKEAKMKESGLNTELFDAENSPVHVCHKASRDIQFYILFL